MELHVGWIKRQTRSATNASARLATPFSHIKRTARFGYRATICAGLAVVASVALPPGASAKSAAVSCASYQGPPATWADFTDVKASGVSCKLAEQLIRALYGHDYAASDLLSVGAANQHIVFRKDVHDETGWFTLRLVGQPPKYQGDVVSLKGIVGSGLPDPNGHQVP